MSVNEGKEHPSPSEGVRTSGCGIVRGTLVTKNIDDLVLQVVSGVGSFSADRYGRQFSTLTSGFLVEECVVPGERWSLRYGDSDGGRRDSVRPGE